MARSAVGLEIAEERGDVARVQALGQPLRLTDELAPAAGPSRRDVTQQTTAG